MGRFFNKVIECRKGNDVAVWKDPHQQFTPPLRLVVRESQEAIFALNGKALDSFGPGSHELELPQLPLLLTALGFSNEKANSFRADVYFFNLADLTGIKWGTRSRIQYVDPVFDIPVSIGASGTFSVAIKQPRKLLFKAVGTEDTMTRDDFADRVRSRLQMNVKTLLLHVITEQKLSVFDLEMHLDEMSLALKESLSPFFEQYGIELIDFVIDTVVLPEGERYFEEYKAQRYGTSSKKSDPPHTATSKRGIFSSFGKNKKNESQAYCGRCGHPFKPEDRFCTECGAKR